METIFVQIPAYRDEEIVPTVKDLFSKAKHPGNVYVGICWQNKLDGDDGTLKLDEFEQNVRIINKDISESEGVGWAKLRTTLVTTLGSGLQLHTDTVISCRWRPDPLTLVVT